MPSTSSTEKEEHAATITMMKTIAVVTLVSLRVGQVTRANFLSDLPQKFERS